MDDLFKELMVWRRLDDASAVRYACINDLQNDTYAVQSADFFRLPLSPTSANDFANQFAELLINSSPHERCIWFQSLAEAIAHHDQEFR